jgi:hypothetical protein
MLRHVEEDFPRLPAGCSIWLEVKARQAVIENIKASIRSGRRALISALQDMGQSTTLEEFVSHSGETGLDLDQLYANGFSLTALRRAAGFNVKPGPDADRLGRAIGRMRHVEDEERVEFYTRTLSAQQPPAIEGLPERERRMLLMLHYGLWTRSPEFADLEASFTRLWQNDAERRELGELLTLLGSRSERADIDPGIDPRIPLRVHQYYKSIEALGAMGVGSPAKPIDVREGVYQVPGVAELFFVTLRKDPSDFKPTTRYRDYALSSTLFHWDSQGRTSVDSPTGQRYIHHRERGLEVLLFVRENKETVDRQTEPFVFLGPVTYRSHSRSRPIAMTWELKFPMPPDFLQVARAVA